MRSYKILHIRNTEESQTGGTWDILYGQKWGYQAPGRRVQDGALCTPIHQRNQQNHIADEDGQHAYDVHSHKHTPFRALPRVWEVAGADHGQQSQPATDTLVLQMSQNYGDGP